MATGDKRLPDKVKSYRTKSKAPTKKRGGKNAGAKVKSVMRPKRTTKSGGIGHTTYVSKGWSPQSGSSQGSGGSTLGIGSTPGQQGSSTGA